MKTAEEKLVTYYKTRLRQYFKAQHKKQHAAREDHSFFIGVLGRLEGYTGKSYFNESENINEVVADIDTLKVEEVESIYFFMEKTKQEVKFKKFK